MIELILSHPIVVLGILMLAALIVFVMVVFAVYDLGHWCLEKWRVRHVQPWHRK